MSARTILKHVYENGGMTKYQYEKIDRVLKERDRPHGEWIREVVVEEPRKNKRAYARCSACGCRYNHYGVAVKHFDYCPRCGSDNRPRKHGCCFADETCKKNPCKDCGLKEGKAE